MQNSRLFSLKGKVALITGGATGIGYQVARAYAEAGATVVLAYNSSGKAAEEGVVALEKEFGIKAKAVKLPGGDAEAAERVLLETEKEFGRLDIVRVFSSTKSCLVLILV